MATYAIGDIQGCYDSLCRLLERCAFDPALDRLWLVGDLVNRGPKSLETLRLMKSLGPAALTVLGNHDLYLLMVAEGGAKFRGKDDTLQAIFDAPDCAELLDWLRRQPLCHTEGEYCLVHAGLLPQWTASRARELAREVEAALQGPAYREFVTNLWGSEPAGHLPWFDAPNRQSADSVLVTGHWSALGLKITPNLLALDSGCLWGGHLTAVRLEDRQVFQVDCSPGEALPLKR